MLIFELFSDIKSISTSSGTIFNVGNAVTLLADGKFDAQTDVTIVVGANDVGEDRNDQPDPHEEQREPENRPEHLAGAKAAFS